jgi:phospholipid/cholesterol/gamma-HCH transport system substrate-binding protein
MTNDQSLHVVRWSLVLGHWSFGEVMDERVAQFRVGVMVLATIIITGILILLFNRFPSLGKGSYTIQVRFPTAPGVAKDTPVRRSGILIGRVTEVEFDENYNVLATLQIDGDHTIFASDEIRITRSLLGDAELEVVRTAPPEPTAQPHATARPELPAADPPDKQPDEAYVPDGGAAGADARHRGQSPFRTAALRSAQRQPYLLAVFEHPGANPGLPARAIPLLAVMQPKSAQQQPPIRDAQPAPAQVAPPPRRGADVPVPEGAIIEGRVAAGPLEALESLQDDFKRAAESLSMAGNEVGGLARNLNGLFERNEQQIDRIITQADRALTSFELAMNSVNDILGDPEVRANLKQTLRDLPNMLQETQRAIASIEGAMRLVESNLRNLEGFTGPLGERGAAIVGNVDSGIARLNQLLGQLESFSRSLNSREGTLGQLINNPEIYNQISEAAATVNELTRELRPILKDVRLFSDQLARHPGIIIRDAIKPRSGTKWVTER